MQNINSYLDKFKNLAVPNESIRKDVAGIIKNEIGIDLEIKDISIKNMVAYIKGGSAVKSEIFLRKKKILEKIKEADKNNEIVDIR
jgi:hypothetical protein